METKRLSVELKDEDQGVVEAQFATLGVKDKDGDVIEPGAFGSQAVRVSSFGHGSWQGALPVGAGTIREEDEKAVADLQFFMNTNHGRDHFETVKGLGALGEWSFGFDILEEAAPDEEQQEVGVRRVLKKLLVHEVSPVLLGAGIGTRTLAVKCDACGAKAGTVEEVDDDAADAEELTVSDEKAEDGSDEKQPAGDVETAEDEVVAESEEVEPSEEDDLKAAIREEVARFEAIQHRLAETV